jgi:hypothetical protein
MPRSSSGKWVTRAASTGGGRSYRGQRPVNWYAGLVLIVILGFVSIVFARYEYQHHKAASAIQPAVGTTLYAGFGFDICGNRPPPPSTSLVSNSAGMTTPGEGVLQVSPKSASDSGNNATLGRFFAEDPTLKLSKTSLTVPNHKPYKNGQVCPAGTPDAGKKGVVTVETWPNAVTTSGTVLTGDPGAFKITARSLITIGFVPSGTKLFRPAQSTINAMLEFQGQVVNGTTSTTTSTTVPIKLPTTSSTTAPSTSTTTTAPTGTTTTTG